MTETRVIACTYINRRQGFRWLVRAAAFANTIALRRRLHAECCLAIALSRIMQTVKGEDLAPAVRRLRQHNYNTAELLLAGLPERLPL